MIISFILRKETLIKALLRTFHNLYDLGFEVLDLISQHLTLFFQMQIFR